MSDVSQSALKGPKRPLRQEEKSLIESLLGREFAINLDAIKVFDLDDGGMGSVRFENERSSARIFGSELARSSFLDSDGVTVSITVNADQNGKIFEIDFWKVDFTPLVAYPRTDQLTKGDL